MTTPNDFYTTLANAPLGHAFAKKEVPPEIWQTLGVGEVEGQIGNLHKTFFHETAFAGIWHIEETEAAYLQIGLYPQILYTAGQAGDTDLPFWPADLMNAQGLLLEALSHVKSQQPFQVNLDHLPLNPADHCFLDTISQGHARIVLKGYGDAIAEKTRFSRLWRVRFFNVHSKLILDTLEVATVPSIVMATPEDWRVSQQTLLRRTLA